MRKTGQLAMDEMKDPYFDKSGTAERDTYEHELRIDLLANTKKHEKG